jgi:hypothetical protein
MDSETLENNTQKNNTPQPVGVNQINGDFPSICVDLIKKTNFKVAIFLYIIGLFIFSDVFIENLLPKKYRDGNCATTPGTMLQLLSLVICYLIIDLLVGGCML